MSFIIPVMDEEATLIELHRRIVSAVAELPAAHPLEIIFVDDGSKDASWTVISLLALDNPTYVRGLRFRGHAGKAAALTAGFRAARGDLLFTLDADLQDDPAEIPRFLEKLAQGFDIVSGWKRVRHDPWHKVWPSRVFNRMLSRLGGVALHDQNCGFKCYRAEAVRGMTLYGELHRMVPSLAAMRGFRSAEIEVRHEPRRYGHSKYGLERLLRGFFDVLTVWFLRRFGERPVHFVGTLSAAMLAAGFLLIFGGALVGILSAFGMLLTVLGAALLAASPGVFAAGLISELLNRGGLEQLWQLRIAEDTALRSKPGSTASVRAVPSTIWPYYSPRPDDIRGILHDSSSTKSKLPAQA